MQKSPTLIQLNCSNGLLDGARQVPSPNCDARPTGCDVHGSTNVAGGSLLRVPAPATLGRPARHRTPGATGIDLLVIHNISLPPGEFGGPHIESLFLNSLDPHADPYFAAICGMKVSAHLLIRRSGEIVQFVPLHLRAWHAGESRFEGRTACNDFSIGIELEGSDDHPYEPAQYTALAEVARTLMAAYPGITPQRIVGHSDIAPGRKTDPGPGFDWERLRSLLIGSSE